MRWRAKSVERDRLGDRRVKRCWAFLPICIDEQWIWLESYWVTQAMQYDNDWDDTFNWRTIAYHTQGI